MFLSQFYSSLGPLLEGIVSSISYGRQVNLLALFLPSELFLLVVYLLLFPLLFFFLQMTELLAGQYLLPTSPSTPQFFLFYLPPPEFFRLYAELTDDDSSFSPCFTVQSSYTHPAASPGLALGLSSVPLTIFRVSFRIGLSLLLSSPPYALRF